MTSTDHITGIAPSHSNRGNRLLINSVYALSFESDQDFERLHADLKKELRPIDPQEEETVLTIAKNCWLEHRLMRAQPMPFPRKAPVSESKTSGLQGRAKNQPRNNSN